MQLSCRFRINKPFKAHNFYPALTSYALANTTSVSGSHTQSCVWFMMETRIFVTFFSHPKREVQFTVDVIFKFSYKFIF